MIKIKRTLALAIGMILTFSFLVFAEGSNKVNIYVDVTSAENLIFDKYDMDVYLDNSHLGTVANGQTFTKKLETEKGSHELIIYKGSNNSIKASKIFDVKGDLNNR